MAIQIEEVAPIRDQVADILRQQILNGELQPETQISERQLSQDFDVSTTPIKEALRILQSEGLIVTKPRRGSFVAETTKDQLLALTFMRSSLEGVAAYWATIYASEEELLHMQEALAHSEELIKAGAPIKQISDSNVQFHRVLRNACRNQYLLNILSNMRSMDITIRARSFTIDEVEPARAHKEHMRVLTAVLKRDSKEAEQAMIDHIRRISTMTINAEKTKI